MKEFLFVLTITVISVGIMTLGLAITRIRKGRDLQSDVGSNDDMKRLGLTCTSKAFRMEEKILRGEKIDLNCQDDCHTCGNHH